MASTMSVVSSTRTGVFTMATLEFAGLMIWRQD